MKTNMQNIVFLTKKTVFTNDEKTKISEFYEKINHELSPTISASKDNRTFKVTFDSKSFEGHDQYNELCLNLKISILRFIGESEQNCYKFYKYTYDCNKNNVHYYEGFYNNNVNQIVNF